MWLRVFTKSKEIAAVSSTQKMNQMAGRYVGKDDPVLIVRCQSGLPAVGEVLEPFANPHLATGWMRGSHYGPIIPVSRKKLFLHDLMVHHEDCHGFHWPMGNY